MRRRTRLALQGLGVGVLAVVMTWGLRSAPDLLARVSLFDVATIRVEGSELLEDREVLEAAGIPDTANVWDDPQVWVDALTSHPVILSAKVKRTLPATLVLEIEERRAVAFLATPVLEPVDAEGRIVPVDPSRVRLDLPIVRLRPSDGDVDGVPTPGRVQPQIDALERLRENPAFLTRLAELREEEDGTVTAFWGSSPGLEVQMRLPIDPKIVDQGMEVLSRALAEDSTRTPSRIDLRWAEQIVVGYLPD